MWVIDPPKRPAAVVVRIKAFEMRNGSESERKTGAVSKGKKWEGKSCRSLSPKFRGVLPTTLDRAFSEGLRWLHLAVTLLSLDRQILVVAISRRYGAPYLARAKPPGGQRP